MFNKGKMYFQDISIDLVLCACRNPGSPLLRVAPIHNALSLNRIVLNDHGLYF